jgi:hypothetical protein
VVPLMAPPTRADRLWGFPSPIGTRGILPWGVKLILPTTNLRMYGVIPPLTHILIICWLNIVFT